MKPRLFLLLASLFLLLTSREPPWADAHVVYDTTQSFVEHGDFHVRLEGGPSWFYARPEGVNGPRYGVFPLGNVLAMVPSYLAYKALRAIPGVPDKPLYATICHLSPALLMAAACILFFSIVQRRMPEDDGDRWARRDGDRWARRDGDRWARRDGDRWALELTFVLAFGTICFIYARSAYAEALQTFALTWLVERTLEAGRRPTTTVLGWLGVAAGILINAKLVFVLVLPLCVAYILIQRRREGDLATTILRSWLALVQLAAFVALALWHNHLKTHAWLDSGYTMRGGLFSGDVPAAVHGFLLSPGKGVLWYSPPLVLGLVGLRESLRRHRDETLLGIGVVVMTILFNAKFRIWHADYCWGPRHLAPLSPIVLSWAVPWLPDALQRGRARLRHFAYASVVAIGVTVQLLGASLYWDHYIRALISVKDQTGAPGWFRESLTQGHYIPVFSPLVGQWWLLRHLVTRDEDLDADAPWHAILPSHANLGETYARLRLDWWPLEWLTSREPRPDTHHGPATAPIASTTIAILLLLLGVTLGARGVRRRLTRSELPREGAAEAATPEAGGGAPPS